MGNTKQALAVLINQLGDIEEVILVPLVLSRLYLCFLLILECF